LHYFLPKGQKSHVKESILLPFYFEILYPLINFLVIETLMIKSILTKKASNDIIGLLALECQEC
jgi:hypothetical protein